MGSTEQLSTRVYRGSRVLRGRWQIREGNERVFRVFLGFRGERQVEEREG